MPRRVQSDVLKSSLWVVPNPSNTGVSESTQGRAFFWGSLATGATCPIGRSRLADKRKVQNLREPNKDASPPKKGPGSVIIKYFRDRLSQLVSQRGFFGPYKDPIYYCCLFPSDLL